MVINLNRQYIKGNHNQQAGNDIINNFSDDDFDPNNPNIIDCPSCWKPTSKFANECQRCGYAVLKHFNDIDKEERKRRAHSVHLRVFYSCVAILLVGLWQDLPMMIFAGALISVFVLKSMES